MKPNSKIRLLTENAILLALSIVLSFITIWKMPMGGEITLVSMLPVMLASIRFGTGTGLVTAFLYSLFQLAMGFAGGNVFVYCTTASTFILVLLFDYLVPFTGLGLAGLLRRRSSARFKNYGIYCGLVIAVFLRFACHYVTGVAIWGQWSDGMNPFLYSLLYNGSYMLPELVLTLAAAFALFKAPRTRKLLLGE